MGMPLRAVADDGYLFGLDEREVGILIVISGGHDFLGSSFSWLNDGSKRAWQIPALMSNSLRGVWLL
jgi:hypothetical protein